MGLIIGILRYVFHNFIIIYHPFCFRERIEIIFPIHVSCHFFCHLLQPPFSRHWEWGGGITVFFLLLGGDYCFFFSITVSGELQNFFGI